MSRQRQPRIGTQYPRRPPYQPPKSREQDQTMMGDMILTNDQMIFLTTPPGLSRTFYTEWIWTENWNAAEKKYIIPYTDHPIQEAQESFYFGFYTTAECQRPVPRLAYVLIFTVHQSF